MYRDMNAPRKTWGNFFGTQSLIFVSLLFNQVLTIGISLSDCKTTRSDLGILKVEIYSEDRKYNQNCSGVAVRRMFIVTPRRCIQLGPSRDIPPKEIKAFTDVTINEVYKIVEVCCRDRLCLLKTDRTMSTIIKPMCINENDLLGNYMLSHYRSIILNGKFDSGGHFSSSQIDLFPTPVFDFEVCESISQNASFPFYYYRKCLCLFNPHAKDEHSLFDCRKCELGSPYLYFSEEGIPHLLGIVTHDNTAESCCTIPIYINVDWMSRVIRDKPGECDTNGGFDSEDRTTLIPKASDVTYKWDEKVDYRGEKPLGTNSMISSFIEDSHMNSEGCKITNETEVYSNFIMSYHNTLITYFYAKIRGNSSKTQSNVDHSACPAVPISNIHFMVSSKCFRDYVDLFVGKDMYLPSVSLMSADMHNDLTAYVHSGYIIGDVMIVRLHQPIIQPIYTEFKHTVCFFTDEPPENMDCIIIAAGEPQNVTVTTKDGNKQVSSSFKFCLPEDNSVAIFCKNDTYITFLAFAEFSGEFDMDSIKSCYNFEPWEHRQKIFSPSPDDLKYISRQITGKGLKYHAPGYNTYLICNDLDYPCYFRNNLTEDKIQHPLKSSVDYIADTQSIENIEDDTELLNMEKKLHLQHVIKEELYTLVFVQIQLIMITLTILAMGLLYRARKYIRDPDVVKKEDYWNYVDMVHPNNRFSLKHKYKEPEVDIEILEQEESQIPFTVSLV